MPGPFMVVIQKLKYDYKEKSIQQLWLDELNEFETAYKKWLKEQEEERLENDKKFKKQGAKKIGRGKK